MISILIATRNRPKQIRACIDSIFQNDFTDFEIILIDQSSRSNNYLRDLKHKSRMLTYIRMNKKGKSKALNYALKLAKGEILAFTDDDCIVDANWLKTIHKTYKSYPRISGVFGNTYPYEEKKHPNKICPATFKSTKVQLCNSPHIVHYHCLGQGNNMSLKKKNVLAVGGFPEWLGVGTLTQAGEESEVIYKLLKEEYTLMTNPNMVVFHNRWLAFNEERFLQSRYTRGWMSFCSFNLIKEDFSLFFKLIKTRFQDILYVTFQSSKETPQFSYYLADWRFFLIEIINILFGFSLGIKQFLIVTFRKTKTAKA